MRKTLSILLVLAALAVGSLGIGAAPVDASASTPASAATTPGGYYYLPAGQWLYLSHGACSARFIYGNYGNIAFTRMEVLNNGCSGLSRVMTQAWGDTSTPCSFLHDPNQYPDCDHGASWVQAVAVGTLIGGYVELNVNTSEGHIWLSPIR